MAAGVPAARNRDDSEGRPAASSAFNPCVIVLQILVLQAFYYFFLALFSAFGNYMFELIPVDFSAQLLGSAAPGAERRIAGLATICACAGPCALLLALLVQKARRCADHAATLLVAHIIVCVSLHGLPHRPLWWILQVSSTVLMSVVAENICRVIEAKKRSSFIDDIKTESKAVGSRTTISPSSNKPRNDDEEEEGVSLLVDQV